LKNKAEKINEATRLLSVAVKDPQKIKDIAAKLKVLEQNADEIGHELIENLRRNFITPLDGEDIDLLRQNLDDIIDYIERAVNRISIYHIAPPFPEEMENYVRIIIAAAREIKDGVREIKNVKKFPGKPASSLPPAERSGKTRGTRSIAGRWAG